MAMAMAMASVGRGRHRMPRPCMASGLIGDASVPEDTGLLPMSNSATKRVNSRATHGRDEQS